MGDQHRRTPRWLYEFANQQFGPFELDAAATSENTLHKYFYDEESDALDPANEWAAKTFCNPPFLAMAPWLHKAISEAVTRDVFTFMIAPQGGSQSWYHDLARQYTILAPNMRINFDDRHGNPTGRCLRDLPQAECKKHCSPPCEWGANRDTTILLIGPGFENPRFDAGEFRLISLDLRNVETAPAR